MSLTLKQTEDGSSTLYSTTLNESYHSIHGARSESLYIFLHNALFKRVREVSSPDKELKKLSILEIGFGTGLNALLTLEAMDKLPKHLSVTYHTFELYPLEGDTLERYLSTLMDLKERQILKRLHSLSWDTPLPVTPRFTLHKHFSDATQGVLPSADVIYMDAFSPENAPLLWSTEMFRRLYEAAVEGAYLSTYCSKGRVRRELQEVGFKVERTPGPPGGKREILVCQKKS